jgi:hypothetical protein
MTTSDVASKPNCSIAGASMDSRMAEKNWSWPRLSGALPKNTICLDILGLRARCAGWQKVTSEMPSGKPGGIHWRIKPYHLGVESSRPENVLRVAKGNTRGSGRLRPNRSFTCGTPSPLVACSGRANGAGVWDSKLPIGSHMPQPTALFFRPSHTCLPSTGALSLS